MSISDLWFLYSLHEDMSWKKINDPSIDTYSTNSLKTKDLEEFINKYNIKWFTQADTDYHFKFHSVKSKPQIMYYMGNLDVLNKKLLGVVWPRLPTEYGRTVTTQLLEHARNHELSTISGLADGIDSLCCEWSIQNNIPTIAVLWGWFQFFLKTKYRIIEKIIWHGWLVFSEFKIWYKPAPYTFPQRNRIIAGLSDLLFLPEAAESSGSLITVDFAIQSHKPIFATPNSIFSPSSTGINKRISEWLIQAVWDLKKFIQTNFQVQYDDSKSNSKKIENWLPLNDVSQQILELLSQYKTMDLALLLSKTDLDIVWLSTLLSILEIQWYIYQPHTGVYGKK